MPYEVLAVPPSRSLPHRSFIVAIGLLPALALGASAVVRLLLPTPFAVLCTTALVVSASTDAHALARSGSLVVAGVEVLLASGLVVRGLRHMAQFIAAIELVAVSIVAAALAQPELLWMGLGLAPLAFLFQNHVLLMIVAVAYVLFLAGAFLVRRKSESAAP